MEETKVLVMSYFIFIPNDLDYGGKEKLKKRVCEEIPQNQNPIDAVRQAILNCSDIDDYAKDEYSKEIAEIPMRVYNNCEGDYIQFGVLSGLKVNGKFYIDLDQCIKEL